MKTCQCVNIIWKYTQTLDRQGGPWTDGISYGCWISLGGVRYRAPYCADNHYQGDASEISRIHYTFHYNLWIRSESIGKVILSSFNDNTRDDFNVYFLIHPNGWINDERMAVHCWIRMYRIRAPRRRMRYCIHTLPRGGKYWEIPSPRPERLPEGAAGNGARPIPRPKPTPKLRYCEADIWGKDTKDNIVWKRPNWKVLRPGSFETKTK